MALTEGFNACSLFTLEEVGRFVGAPVDLSAKITTPDDPGLVSAGGCAWSKRDPVGDITRLQLVVAHVTDFSAAKAPLEAETTYLAGLGDWAGWNTAGTNMNVAALNHNVAMIISCDIATWESAVPTDKSSAADAEQFRLEGEAQRNRCNVPIVQDLFARLV